MEGEFLQGFLYGALAGVWVMVVVGAVRDYWETMP